MVKDKKPLAGLAKGLSGVFDNRSPAA